LLNYLFIGIFSPSISTVDDETPSSLSPAFGGVYITFICPREVGWTSKSEAIHYR